MNDPFVADQALGWAERAMAISDDPTQRIHWLYESAFGRLPNVRELATATDYIGGSNETQRWADFAHALINTKEFVFLR